MKIKEIEGESFVTLIPVGDLDANSSIEMDECMERQLNSGVVNFHIDGSELQYISSAGLGVFISHLEEIEQKEGKIVFSGLSQNVQDVFQLLGLDQIVEIFPSSSDVPNLFATS
ncbi:MAG: STAS domain-containing protein [Bacteroidota bacterium]